MRFNRKKFFILFLGIVVILILGFYQGGVKNFFYLRSQSFQKNLWQKGDNLSGFFEGVLNGKKLKEENEGLRKYNRELLKEIAHLRGLEEENRKLREALDCGLQEDYKLALADLVSKDTSGDFILINKGSRGGFRVGMPVVTEEKMLLGKINEVYEDFSRVVLISNPESSFPAEVQGKEASGIIKGKGASQISLEKVPQEKEVKEGDIVITSSLGEIFPKGLLIGKIERVQESDIEPFQKVEMSLFFDVEELKTVFVIIDF
jgi:rod shape-determining protein MreC